MSETITPANLIFTVLHLLLDDVDTDALLEHAGIPVQRVLEPEGSLTIPEVVRISQCAQALTDDPALGLHLGQELGTEMLDVVGMMMSTAPDLRAAIHSTLQYSPLLTTLGHAELEEDGDEARIVLHLLPEVEPIALYCAELVWATVWSARRLVRGEAVLRRLTFRQPAPAWADEFHQVFGEETEIVFGAPRTTLVLDRRSLDLPMARHTPGLYQRLQEQAARRLASRLPAETASATALARRIIEDHLGERLLDLTVIAQHMGMSPRTLQRRLKDEGTTFQGLYDACRQQVARTELLEHATDMATIAAMLGYSEPANFYRAFRDWFGISPSEYRKQHRGAGGFDPGVQAAAGDA
jgi:AraC-like DNA-binding protein